MPSTYAHYRFGRDVFAKLPQDIKKIIQGDEDLFNIGVHGPDLLFYFRPLTKNPVNAADYGQHDKPAREFFFPAAKAVFGGGAACKDSRNPAQAIHYDRRDDVCRLGLHKRQAANRLCRRLRIPQRSGASLNAD